MSTIKTWISALRLRTIPLAASAILTGAAIADFHYSADRLVALLCFTTAIALQMLSNLANDYGDFVKGTDNDKRLGNMRALQSGNITVGQMRVAIILFVVLCLVSGISLLFKVTQGEINTTFLLFFLLGIAAIAAAIKYTVGKNAYGYSGLGDVAVFIFFGPVAVIGTFLLCNGLEFTWPADAVIFLPAAGIGLLSTAVLNTNNIRDIENDKASGKYTIPVKIGLQKARVYHTVLIVTALLCFFVYSLVHEFHWVKLFQIPASALIIGTLIGVRKNEPSPAFNQYLKKLSLGTLLFVIVFIFTNWLTKMLALRELLEYFGKLLG
jgi:1,4-dihydroxy-2-naphthoate octaprenyltransferase